MVQIISSIIALGGCLHLSTWKLSCTCPKCKEEHLYADIDASMILYTNWLWTFLGLGKWAFTRMPAHLYCQRCGNISKEETNCELPVIATPTGLRRFLWILTLAMIVAMLIYIVIINYLKW
jgi:hypothetical protein